MKRSTALIRLGFASAPSPAQEREKGGACARQVRQHTHHLFDSILYDSKVGDRDGPQEARA
ncbi:hypothetical protein SAMN05519104_7190 [Rhizobiales bacterium GAS188]|nr:hypothetical protein SAMN05519104_7190 [Rhizobiales bacterium GAS188]